MGTWNTGPFDNDDAVDLIEDIREGELDPVELLPDATTRYIEADQGAMVIAMAHLAAGELPEGMSTEQVSHLRSADNRERLRQCLEAVLSDDTVSELHAVWAKAGEEQLHEWKAKSHVDLS